jgi:ankyrin repeat protein
MSKREREDEEAASESELGAAAQRAANDELLEACRSGTVVEVKAALREGANWNATCTQGRTGLMLACMREPCDVVVSIVKLLLRKNCPVSQCDGSGWNALHYACVHSSAEVVRLLLEADKKAAGRCTDEGSTCLMKCAGNGNAEEAVKIATLAMDSGCPVNATDSAGRTALLYAAISTCAQMVSLLIARGADVHAKNAKGGTALRFACANGVYGREVIPVLCAAGADVMARTQLGTAFERALMTSKAMADAMVPFLPAGFKLQRAVASFQDPVGSFTCAVELGAPLGKNFFSHAILRTKTSCAGTWANLRNGQPLLLDGSEDDVFRSLVESKDAELWKWASSEPLMQQHPITGDTMFHLLCNTEALTIEQKLVVLADLKLHYRNPLTPNYHNELCVQLAREPELKKALQEYACWQPHRLAMEWFGPLFQKRAFALLLVCYRLKAKHPKLLAGLNRDIRHLLVQYASRVEYIYVPSKI